MPEEDNLDKCDVVGLITIATNCLKEGNTELLRRTQAVLSKRGVAIDELLAPKA